MSESELIILQLLNEGYFSIDDQGHIWRHIHTSRTGRRKTIDPVRADKVRMDGYSTLKVQIECRTYHMMTHRLVWASIHGLIPGGMEINHRDGRRSNNRPGNLELMTPSENTLHSYRVLGKRSMAGELNGTHKLTRGQVEAIRSRVAAGATKRGLAREYGVTPTAIRHIIAGRLWKSEFPQTAVEVS